MANSEESKDLDKFLVWCKENKITINPKIHVTSNSTSHRYGVIALEDIKCNETLVDIPRCITLSPSQSSVANKLEEYTKKYEEKLGQTSGWIPLLLSLMYEIKKKDSFWVPYLTLCPEVGEFHQPMFWDEEERQEELAGLSVLWDVQRDLFNIEKEYKEFVVPFIEENKDLMSLENHNLDLYKHMVGFVMSYSFTDTLDGTTVMVPIADIFNHHSNNNAALSFEDKSTLRMISTRSIKKGEEIFNTFGKLGNAQLLHMYGFVEKSHNAFDTAEIPLTSVVDVLEAADADKLPVLQAMLAYMRKMGIADEKEPFVFCSAGLKSGPDLYAVLRILHMELKEFTGLLQDHIKWYQDSYFLYLLQHVQEATSGGKQGKDDDKVIEIINDSDDEIIIVKEVKGNAAPRGPEVRINEVNETGDKEGEVRETEATQSQKLGNETGADLSMASQDMTPSTKVEESETGPSMDKPQSLIFKEKEEEIPTDSVNEQKIADLNSQPDKATEENSSAQIIQKQSPVLDVQKKSKNRKRKLAQPIVVCEDSDDDLEITCTKPARKPNAAKIRKNKNNKFETNVDGNQKNCSEVNDGVESGELEDEKELFMSAKDDDYSEDPDDGTDDEDSETYLQLSYDQINSILHSSWKATMKGVITSAIDAMKEDSGEISAAEMTGHSLLAYEVRNGQRKILQLLEKSLAS